MTLEENMTVVVQPNVDRARHDAPACRSAS